MFILRDVLQLLHWKTHWSLFTFSTQHILYAYIIFALSFSFPGLKSLSLLNWCFCRTRCFDVVFVVVCFFVFLWLSFLSFSAYFSFYYVLFETGEWILTVAARCDFALLSVPLLASGLLSGYLHLWALWDGLYSTVYSDLGFSFPGSKPACGAHPRRQSKDSFPCVGFYICLHWISSVLLSPSCWKSDNFFVSFHCLLTNVVSMWRPSLIPYNSSVY